MSQVATTWAVKVRGISAAEARVLWHLADCHNPVFGCFPDQDYLAEGSEMDVRSVRRQLVSLRGKGLIRWDETREGNRRGRNRYHLAFEAGFQPDNLSGSSEPDNSDASTGQITPFEPDTGVLTSKPVREPVIEPERESAGAREAEKPDRGLLAAMIARHPHVAHDSGPGIDAAFAALTPAERAEAAARHADWLADKGPRTAIAALSTYLREKRWTRLPGPAPAKAGPVSGAFVQPWSRPWWRLFLDHCETNRSLVGDHRSAPGSILRRHVSAARNRLGWNAGTAGNAAEIEERAKRLVQVEIGSEAWRRWQAHARARYGIDLPEPDQARFAFLPGPEPPDAGAGLGLSRDDLEAIG